MKTQLVKKLWSNVTLITAIIFFILFSSLRKDIPSPAATEQCCSGYSMTNADLQQFMLDSLNSIQFEGGVYSKADLLAAINNLNPLDDSVYLVNILVDCAVSSGTDLALTSRHTTGISFVREKKLCKCPPPKPCCRNAACVAKIKRSCINFKPFTPAAFDNNKANAFSLEQ